jgi:hypothetical protein
MRRRAVPQGKPQFFCEHAAQANAIRLLALRAHKKDVWT